MTHPVPVKPTLTSISIRPRESPLGVNVTYFQQSVDGAPPAIDGNILMTSKYSSGLINLNGARVDITCESDWSGGTSYSCGDAMVTGGDPCMTGEDPCKKPGGSHCAPYSSIDIGMKESTKTISCDSDAIILPPVGSAMEVVCLSSDWKEQKDGSYMCGYTETDK